MLPNIKGLIITGYGRHGKDTVCQYLKTKYGITYGASSEIANDLFIYDLLKDKMGYKSKEECFNDRHSHRQLWFELICEYNNPKYKLGQHVFSRYGIYCGLRSKEELEALRAAGLVKAVVWVDASKRLSKEEGSIDIDERDADFTLCNNGSLVELYANVDRMLRRL